MREDTIRVPRDHLPKKRGEGAVNELKLQVRTISERVETKIMWLGLSVRR